MVLKLSEDSLSIAMAPASKMVPKKMTQISVPLSLIDETKHTPPYSIPTDVPASYNSTEDTPLALRPLTQGQGACRDRLARFWEMPDQFTVNTREAAAMLGRSKRTLEGWRLRHTGPAYQAGGRVTYTIGDLKAYLKTLTVRTSSYA